MPETVSTMLGAILDLTDDAILVIDPPSRTIQFSSPRAIEIIGRTLASDNVPVSHIFANDEAEFDHRTDRAQEARIRCAAGGGRLRIDAGFRLHGRGDTHVSVSAKIVALDIGAIHALSSKLIV